MAELPDQDDPAILLQRHHRCCAGMAHDFQVNRETVGQSDGVDIQVHDDASVDVLGHEERMAQAEKNFTLPAPSISDEL
jgi:hypothetical protein